MRSICKSNAFHAWCEMLETKRKLRSIGKRMMNTQLAGAITGWKSFVSEKVATRQLMVKVMNRMHKTLLNSGFRSWLDYSRMVVDREFREGIRNRRMLLVVQRMKFLRVSKTFTTWKMLRKTMKVKKFQKKFGVVEILVGFVLVLVLSVLLKTFAFFSKLET
jgi:hypothetical protein